MCATFLESDQWFLRYCVSVWGGGTYVGLNNGPPQNYSIHRNGIFQESRKG